jgi:hypothetical protein
LIDLTLQSWKGERIDDTVVATRNVGPMKERVKK